MKVYMDVCCLNRPFDNQEQDRIRMEAEAVLSILDRCQSGEWFLSASDMIELELSKLTNIWKMEKVGALYSLANQNDRLVVDGRVKERAAYFRRYGVKLFDSLHLALAEVFRRDVLVTTDDQFLLAANAAKPEVVVANPVTWLMEVLKNG